MTSLKFRVTGMMCVMCRDHVKKAAESVQGVFSAEANLASGTLKTVIEDGADASKLAADIAKRVTDEGYEIEPMGQRYSSSFAASENGALCKNESGVPSKNESGAAVNGSAAACRMGGIGDESRTGAESKKDSAIQNKAESQNQAESSNAPCKGFRSGAASGAQKPRKSAAERELTALLNRFIICAAAAAAALGSMMLLESRGASGALLSGVVGLFAACLGIWVCRARFIAGLRHIFSKNPTMDSLIFAGVSSAFLFSLANLAMIASGSEPDGRHMYFEACSMILAFVSLGKYIEARCKRRAAGDMGAALSLLPDIAHLVSESGACRDADAAMLKKGDLVLIKPGERVPADGVIEEGSAYFDESAVTGEALPSGRQTGDRLFAGTLDKDGAVKMRVVSAGEFTAAARIASIIEEASSGKSPHARLADRIAARFVPILFAISLATFAVWLVAGGSAEDAVMHAAAVLLVSCPCALGLAVPMSVLTASSAAAKRGIVFKTAESLELLSEAKAAALDKTGTLTLGEPKVASAEPCGMSEKDFMRALSALEKGSGHPLAAAVQTYAKEMFEGDDECQEGAACQTDAGCGADAKCRIDEASDVRTFPGLGIEGQYRGKIWRIGSRKFAAEALPEASEHVKEADAGTALHAVFDGRYAGRVLFSDRLKETAKPAAAALRRLGITSVMLTGDNEGAAFWAARSAGFADTDVMHSLLPEGKAAAVAKLKTAHGMVIAAGDGINDGPMLATADVGIAMGGGADLAVETADVVLMRADPLDVARACELSKRTVRNMKTSLAWCFLYNILCVPVAAGLLAPFGIFFSPVWASAAMSASSICVMLNALRLLRLSKPGTLASDRASA